MELKLIDGSWKCVLEQDRQVELRWTGGSRRAILTGNKKEKCWLYEAGMKTFPTTCQDIGTGVVVPPVTHRGIGIATVVMLTH